MRGAQGLRGGEGVEARAATWTGRGRGVPGPWTSRETPEQRPGEGSRRRGRPVGGLLVHGRVTRVTKTLTEEPILKFLF